MASRYLLAILLFGSIGRALIWFFIPENNRRELALIKRIQRQSRLCALMRLIRRQFSPIVFTVMKNQITHDRCSESRIASRYL